MSESPQRMTIELTYYEVKVLHSVLYNIVRQPPKDTPQEVVDSLFRIADKLLNE
jgi:hypothetical protein